MRASSRRRAGDGRGSFVAGGPASLSLRHWGYALSSRCDAAATGRASEAAGGLERQVAVGQSGRQVGGRRVDDVRTEPREQPGDPLALQGRALGGGGAVDLVRGA